MNRTCSVKFFYCQSAFKQIACTYFRINPHTYTKFQQSLFRFTGIKAKIVYSSSLYECTALEGIATFLDLNLKQV